MTKLYRNQVISNEGRNDIYLNPSHISYIKVEDGGVAVGIIGFSDELLLCGDLFTAMLDVNDGPIEIINTRLEEPVDDTDVNNTEYVDEQPLEEPGAIFVEPYPETDDVDTANDLEPEQFDKVTGDTE